MKKVDLTGKRFGMLLATHYVPASNKGEKGKWACKCDCGGSAMCFSANLKTGNSSSCGCKRSSSRSKVSAEMKFGRLTVIRRDGSIRHGKACFAAWLCICECGQETRVIGMSLSKGDTRSCGCLLSERTSERARLQYSDLTGRRFGRLTVLDRATAISSRTKLRWLCLCDCGDMTIVEAGSLSGGMTASCGCAKRNNDIVRPKDQRIRSARYGARRRAAERNAFRPFNRELFELVEIEAYHLAQLRTELTGIQWDVDHVIPLQSDTVCGLHNEFNLAVITAQENGRKKNLYWPDMP